MFKWMHACLRSSWQRKQQVLHVLCQEYESCQVWIYKKVSCQDNTKRNLCNDEWRIRISCIPWSIHLCLFYFQGTTFKQQCIEYYANCTNLVSYEEFYAGERGKSFCEELWKVGEHRFPHYMDELKGMSDGAGIPLSKVIQSWTLNIFSSWLSVYFTANVCSVTIWYKWTYCHNL